MSVDIGSGRKVEEINKDPIWDFGSIDCDLSTSSPISSNLKILVSAHPIGKLKIVLENLRSREDMVKNPFWYFECFTSRNPCDSSPPLRWNHELETPEKFLKQGFSFFNPNIPFSLETRPKCQIDWLLYQKTILGLEHPLWAINPKKILRHEQIHT